MNIKLHFPVITPLMLTAVLLSACTTTAPDPRFYGDPAPPSSAQRTIVIQPNTRHVNVEGGQIVRFVSGDKDFAWNFFVATGISTFALNEIAPPGVLDHPVQVYVKPDPKYMGGNGMKNR